MPVKIKVFAVVMAVMCLMSLTCTAFAAETDLPPGAVVVGNGDTVSTNDLTSLDAPRVIPADGVESITITGLFGFSSVYGWDGTQWVNLNVADPANVTIVPADYPEYTYYTMLRGDTMASQTVTVSWVKTSLLEKVLTSVGTFISTTLTAVGGPVLSFITSSPLTLVPALAGLLVLGICIVRRFVYGA